MKTSDIKRLGEAWLKVTSGESLELAEKAKLDPVDDKANDKKFKDRKDKDIDNDGDVDSSDEYLHKRRAATDDAIDGGKKPAKNEKLKKENEDEEESDEPKKKKPFPPKKDGEEKDSEEGEESEEDEEEKEMPKVAGKKNDKKKVASTAKTPEISKIGEELDLVDAIKDLHQMWESAAKQQKSNATKPEEIDSKDSPKAKEFTSAHKGKSDKKIEDNEEDGHDKTFKAQGGTKPKSGKRPQDNQAGDTNVAKSTEAPVKGLKEGAKVVDATTQEGSVSLVDMARAQLAGEIKHDKEKDKNPFDARTKKAKEFLERMAKRRG